MQKTIKIFFILLLFFSQAFLFALPEKAEAQAPDQADIEFFVNTTGYSILSPNEYIFGGYYQDGFPDRPLTTYFEFQRITNENSLAPNYEVEKEETIPIVRSGDTDTHGYFYSSPELKLFTEYRFRAVAFFNDTPDELYYGNSLRMSTGYYPNGQLFLLGAPAVTVFYSAIVYDGEVTRNEEAVLVGRYNGPASCLQLKEGEKCSATVTSSPICPDSAKLLRGRCVVLPSDEEQRYEACMQEVQDAAICSQQTSRPTNPSCTASQVLLNGVCVEKEDRGSGTSIFSSIFGNSSGSNGGETGLVKCGTERYTEEDGKELNGKVSNPCDFNALLDMINRMITFILFSLALPIAAIMFAYAGFELATSGGDTTKVTKAKSIFLNVAIGFVLAAGAFLIIKTILVIVGYNTSWNWFGF